MPHTGHETASKKCLCLKMSKNVWTTKPALLTITGMSTATTLDEMIDQIMQQIADAAKQRDLAAVASLTRRAAELEEMRKTLSGIEERVKELKYTPVKMTVEKPITDKLREFPIEVTQGMKNQNLLTLTA